MTALRVASWNIGNGTGGDLVTIARTADVICLQEASDRDAMINAFTLANPDWILFRSDAPGAHAVPILVNTTTAGLVMEVTAPLAVPRRFVGRGAGPRFSKPKVITHVELDNGTHVLNTHMIASATRRRRYLGRIAWLARRRHYRDHIAAIVALADTLDGPVTLCGDFNAEVDFDLIQPLLGFDGWTAEGTHGRRAIDHVLHLPDRGLTVTGPTEVIDTASDHAAVVVPFEREETPVAENPPFERVTFRGKLMDNKTKAFLLAMERQLGYELTVTQGCWNPGTVAASGGTHGSKESLAMDPPRGGGVVDLAEFEADRKVRVARDLGGFGWVRPAIPGLWPKHCHVGIINHGRLSPQAQDQQVKYLAGEDGLAGHNPDPNPYRPDPQPIFQYRGIHEGPVPMDVDGVDISHHQGGDLDFAAAKAAGVKFVYHKATEGTTVTDERYDSRRVEAKAAGLRFGAYHFARPEGSDARAEAEHFLEVAAINPGDLAPTLDLEVDGGLNMAELTDWAQTWVRVVRRAVGANPIIYTPYDLDRTFGCLLWRPRYNNDNRPPALRWDIWQFSNGELGVPNRVAGLGHVDLNHMRAGLKVSDFVIQEPEPEPPPVTGVSVARAKFLALIAESQEKILPRRTEVLADIEAFKQTVQAWPED